MSRRPPARLGAFELVQPIRRGGMAQVWRAVHVEQRVPVAVKLVTERRARTGASREALHNEVRAMARLDHAGILRVHDYGELGPGHEFPPESPYLVMDFADGGTLTLDHAPDWSATRAVLESILGALAHAHSRGVIHRDIKPSNVLVCSAGERYRLSDFGIAHALSLREDGVGEPAAAGTAWFMAPEQILGLHRDEGPWTDLYAVGCLAFLLASGVRPFAGPDRRDVYRAHCLSIPPRMLPRFAVPRELEAWVRVLLEKRPRDRFASAVDAKHALHSLGEPLAPALAIGPIRIGRPHAPNADARTETALPIEPLSEVTSDSVPVEDRPTLPPTEDVVELDPQLRRTMLALRTLERAIPAKRPPDSPPDAIALRGIGLGLYGLRPIPMSGRAPERQRLWELLRDAEAERRVRAVVLRGPTGHGKTRLAEWLAESALEHGVARVVWARLDPRAAAGDGVIGMIARHLRADGLSAAELAERLEHHPSDPSLDALDGADRARLIRLITGGDATLPADERFATLASVASVLASTRPLVVVLDDAHLREESIAFVDHLLRARSSAPILAVLTAQDEALAERPIESKQLEALCARPEVECFRLGPLRDREHAQLVGSILGLEPVLADQIAARTSGNPLFAIQLVGDWVQRGELVTGPAGFALRDGATPILPDDLHALWIARLDRLLEAIAPEARGAAQVALELAALLGPEVARLEWRAACQHAQVQPPANLLEVAASRRMMVVGPARFSFVHGMLAESLVRGATERGRIARLHAACARALRSSASAERVGRHLVAAGNAREAAPLLLEAARSRLATSDFREVHLLCELRDESLASIGVAPSDPERTIGFALRAEASIDRGRLEEAERWLARALRDEQSADVLRLRGRLAMKRAQSEDAARLYLAALERYRAAGQELEAAHALHGLGEAEKLLGRLDAALVHHEEAAATFDRLGDVLDAARVRMGTADVLRRRGQLDRAVQLIEQNLAVTRRLGHRYASAVALNTLGDIARARGEFERAERLYRECIVVLEALASREGPIVRINLGLVQLARRHWASARASFDLARSLLTEDGRRGYVLFAAAGTAMAAAGEGAWPEFDAALDEVEALSADVPIVDHDLEWLLRGAAETARAAREYARARRAERRAAEQRAGLGR